MSQAFIFNLKQAQQSIKAYVDAQTTLQDLDIAPDSGSAQSIDLDGATLTFSGGTEVGTSASGTTVTLITAPASGTQVKILHKKGQVWYTAADGNPSNGLGLQASTTAQAKFIGEEPTNAPE